MTDETSPRPWRLEDGFACEIVDATGRHVLTATSSHAVPPLGDEREAANAALIVDAVNFYDATVDKQLTALLNERDRLRDLVRRLLPIADIGAKFGLAEGSLIKGFCAIKGVNARVVDVTNESIAALLREARAALGEGGR